MKRGSVAKSCDGVTLRQAALVAGFPYLLNPVSYAEFSIYPKLVAANNAAQTLQNISAHLGLFAVAIHCASGSHLAKAGSIGSVSIENLRGSPGASIKTVSRDLPDLESRARLAGPVSYHLIV